MTQLDRTAISLAPSGASLSAKLSALAAFVAEHLSAFDPAFGLPGRVVTHLDQAVILSASRRERSGIMGDPARYAEVFPADAQDARPGVLAGASGETYDAQHELAITVYYGLDARAPGPQAADTEAMRRLVEGAAGSDFLGAPNELPGLRVALAAQAYLTDPDTGTELPVSGVRLAALRPAAVQDGTGREWRHEALILLTTGG